MAKPKMTGLGKGLDALFGGPTINKEEEINFNEEEIRDDDNLRNLKMTEVEPNRD